MLPASFFITLFFLRLGIQHPVAVPAALPVLYLFYRLNRHYLREKIHIIALITGSISALGFEFYIYNNYAQPGQQITASQMKGGFYVMSASENSAIGYFTDASVHRRIRLSGYPHLSAGDKLKISCSYRPYTENNSTFITLETLSWVNGICRASGSYEYRDENLKQKLSGSFHPDSIAPGFLLALTAQMNASHLQTFRSMGIAHLFSASGLHLGLLFAIFYLPFRWFKRGDWGMTAGFIAAAAFLVLLDFRLSLLRAFIFLSLFLLLRILDRRTSPLFVLFTSAMLIELIFPFSIFSVSFLLSFGVTAGILVFFRPFSVLFNRLPRFLSEHLALTLAASGTALLFSYWLFQGSGPWSLFYNLLLVPYASLYLVAVLTALIFNPATPLLLYTEEVFHLFRNFHLQFVEIPAIATRPLIYLLWMCLFAAFALLNLYLYHRRQSRRAKKISRLTLPLLLLLLPVTLMRSEKPESFYAFPYGICYYNNAELIISGKPAGFLDSIPCLDRAPFQAVESLRLASEFKRFNPAENISYLHESTVETGLENGVFEYNNNCFIYMTLIRPEQWGSRRFSECRRLLVVTPKAEKHRDWGSFFSIFGYHSEVVNIPYFEWFSRSESSEWHENRQY